MKSFILSLLSLAVALAVIPWDLHALDLQIGEKFTYQLKYGLIKAGISTMEVQDIETVRGHTTYRLHSRTRSNNFVDTFYRVRDSITSWIDTSSIATVQFEKSLNEGKYQKDYHVWFDYDNMRAISSDTTFSIESQMQDVLSLFYYIRSFDISVGDTIRMSNFDNDKISPFWISVVKEEQVKVPAGTYTCLVVEPFVESDFLFKYEGNLKIWFTKDERSLPVLMKSKALFGSMILRMTSYDPGNTDDTARTGGL